MGEEMNPVLLRGSNAVIRSSIRPGLGLNVAHRLRSTAAETAGVSPVVAADYSGTALKYFHKTNILVIGLTPIAFLLPDTGVATMACNVTLGILYPLHGHIGMAGCLTDYVPKISKGLLPPARMALLGITGITLLGLLKLNVSGEGMTK